MDKSDINILRTNSIALFKDLKALVHDGQKEPLKNLLLLDLTRSHALGFANLGNLVKHALVYRALAVLIIVVVTSTTLHAKAAVNTKPVVHVGLRVKLATLLAAFEGNVASQVAKLEWTERHAIFNSDAINLGKVSSLHEQRASLGTVVRHHAVGNKSMAVASEDAPLANASADIHCSSNGCSACLGTANNLEQRHDVSRAEEVHANDVLRTLRGAANLINAKERRVGSQDATRFAVLVKKSKDFLLYFHDLKHRFDNNINIRDIFVACGSAEAREVLINLLLSLGSTFHTPSVVGLNHRHTLIKERLLTVKKSHCNACLGESHCNSASHETGTDESRLFHLDRLLLESRNF
mmetsp:Transcript_21415/g.41999  ORF Transcript_21415/g.41999 Transcript_21415/m.41999 type:complete len:352 (+) Transcript_21415:272-1327(+)